MKKLVKYRVIQLLVVFLNLLLADSYAQAVPQGITYQGLARNAAGVAIASQPVSVKVGIYSPTVSGTLQWEESHSVTTNQLGLFYFIIGQGTSTGGGALSSFSMINWGAATHFVKIALDETGGSSYVNIDTMQLWSVPYAMYSGTSGSVGQVRLNDLTDVDTLGVFTGAVLKWNGSLWMPASDNDSDTALYAANAGFSNTSDTANYAINVLSSVDTVNFAYNTDSAIYASSAGSALNAVNSAYCDTATYALNVGSTTTYWNLSGNSGTNPLTNFVGTIDNKDLVLKTNNAERMRITAAGKVGIGTASPSAALHLVGNDGIVAEGTFGSGAVPPSGAGTRMVWYPKKGSFRAGGVSSTQWDDVNIGNYSFASGYNNRASGLYSSAFGSGNVASGQYSLAACELSTASGVSSIALGNACVASGAYSTGLGRGSQATDSSAVAIGYHPTASGKYSFSLGYTTVASGDYSFAFGYAANSNNKSGSFVYADASSGIVTNSTANNQFMARASGGVIFYTNAGLTSGVSLAAGSGSWSSVSDRNKKEHLRKENANEILEKLSNLEVASWNYKTQSSEIRHIGPMAQDFYKAFKFGESDTTITTVDIDGVSLIAIQALSQKTKELSKKAEEIKDLKLLVAKLEKEKIALEKRVVAIEKKVSFTANSASASIK